MMRPATGSAHHHPSAAFKLSPVSRIAEKYMQNSVCFASAAIAPLKIWRATLRFSLAGDGMTISDVAARAIPPTLGRGGWR